MIIRRAALVFAGAGLGFAVYLMTDWPVVARAALAVVFLIVVAALFAPAWRQEEADVEESIVVETPLPTVVDRTPRNGDDVGRDVTK